MKQQYEFSFNRKKKNVEVLEDVFSAIGANLRNQNWEKSSLDQRNSRRGKLVIIGTDLENEEWIIDDVDKEAVVLFYEKTGRIIPIARPARKLLCCISVYDTTVSVEPIFIAGIRHSKSRGFSRLLPEWFNINTMQLQELILELHKLKFLKTSDPNIKWIIS